MFLHLSVSHSVHRVGGGLHPVGGLHPGCRGLHPGGLHLGGSASGVGQTPIGYYGLWHPTGMHSCLNIFLCFACASADIQTNAVTDLRDVGPPSVQIFHFTKFLGKIWLNSKLMLSLLELSPLWEILDPPLICLQFSGSGGLGDYCHNLGFPG